MGDQDMSEAKIAEFRAAEAKARRDNEQEVGLILIFAMGLSAFAPPVGVGFYATCAIIGTTFEKSIRHVVPYALVLFIGLLLVVSVPWFSLILPDLLHMGSSP